MSSPHKNSSQPARFHQTLLKFGKIENLEFNFQDFTSEEISILEIPAVFIFAYAFAESKRREQEEEQRLELLLNL